MVEAFVFQIVLRLVVNSSELYIGVEVWRT